MSVVLRRASRLLLLCAALSSGGLAGCSSSPGTPPGDGRLRADGTLDAAARDVAAPDGAGDALEISPVNALVFIDTAVTPAVPAVVTYTVRVHSPTGATRDVSASAKLVVDDPTLGSFAGAVFTSTDKLSGGSRAVTTRVRVTAESLSAAVTLTIVAVKKSGNAREPYFVLSAGSAPTPAVQVVKFGSGLKAVDLVILMDTTMVTPIANLKTNLTATLIPALKKAVPDLGIAVAYHDDYPILGYGAPGCGKVLSGDLPVGVVQTVTTSEAAAQDAVNKLEKHCGGDGMESQIPAMHHLLTGDAVTWPGGAVAGHTPAAGTFGGAEFRFGAQPVIVEITDTNWHDDYSFPHPTMADLKKAFVTNNARLINITESWSVLAEAQANELSDATKSNIPPSAFGAICGAGQCCTGVLGAARPPTGPGGTCRLNFLHSNGTGLTDAIVKAVQAITVGATYDVYAQLQNAPTNGSVDATQLFSHPRAMSEGDAASMCPAHSAKDTDADGVVDRFVAVVTGTPVCFELLPKAGVTLPPATDQVQLLRLTVLILGAPGAVSLDKRDVLLIIPPRFPT